MSTIAHAIANALQLVISGRTDDDSAMVKFTHKKYGDFEIVVRRPKNKRIKK